MYNEISFIFSQMGYEPVKLNVAEPHVNIKLVNSDMSAGTEGYVVVTLDETSGIRYTEEQFRHISQQIRDFLVHKGCMLYHFLYIFISDNGTPPFKLQDACECLWRITPSGRQLIIYGNALPMYMGLKKPIEDFLMPGNLSGNIAHNPAGNCRQYNYTADNNILAARVNLAIVIINVFIFILSDLINWLATECPCLTKVRFHGTPLLTDMSITGYLHACSFMQGQAIYLIICLCFYLLGAMLNSMLAG